MKKSEKFGETRLIKQPFYPVPSLLFPFYGAAVFGLCCYAIIRKNTPMGIAATFLMVLPVISLIYAFICFCGISAELSFDKQFLRKGESAHATLTVYNYFPIPLPGLTAALYLPKEEKDGYVYTRIPVKSKTGVTMGGLRAVTAVKQVSFGLAGRFTVYCKKLSVHDPLGLFRIVSKAEFTVDMPVIPVEGRKTEQLRINTGMGEGADRNRRGDDRDEVFEIADYTPGDSLKDIHWKRSAREEELQIIRFASPKEKCHCVLCDTGDYLACGTENKNDKNPALLDAVLETAYGMCISLSSEGDSVLLAWRDGKEDIGVTASMEEGFISLCKSGYIPLGTGKRIDPVILSEADAVTLVTAAVNEDTAAQIIALQTEAPNIKGIAVMVCAPEGSAPITDENIIKKLESAGIIIGFSLAEKGGKV